MEFEGALIKEQGVTFGILIVKPHIMNSQSESQNMQRFGKQIFGLVPIVLMAQDSRGIPTYLGRKDIVSFLSHMSISRIPWRKYTIN